MGSPNVAVRQRDDLATAFEEFNLAMNRRGYIGDRVFPVVEVGKQAGTFSKIPLEQLLQSPDTVRAPGSGYARGDWTFEQAAYATIENGYEEPLDDREVQMYRDLIDAELISSQRAFDAVLGSQERRVAAKVYNTTTWTGSDLTTAITHEWDDATNAVPITDVKAAAKKIWDGSGLWPNALIINEHIFKNLRLVDQITDAIASAGAGASVVQADISMNQIAQALDLQFIIISGSAKNTANEGQDATIASVWGDENAMVAKIAVTNDFKEPCIGRTFHWAEDGSTIAGTVEEYREEKVRSQIFRVRHDVAEVVLYPQAGHLLSNVTTI